MIPAASTPPRRRWRWQFSLFTLFLVAIVACVVAAYFGTARRLEEAKAAMIRQDVELKVRDVELKVREVELKVREVEIAKLKAELGKLTIKDPSKVHILTLPSKEDWHWRWRVYVPPDKTWKVTHALDEKVPTEGFGLSSVSHGSCYFTGNQAEFTAEAWLARDINGLLRINLRFCNSQGASGISEEDAKKLMAGGITSSRTAGMSATEVYEPAGPIELLRLLAHHSVRQPDGTSIMSEKPDFGILLFLEEAKQR